MAINVASVQHAVYTMLSSDSVLVSSGFTVDLNTDMNTDPNRVPWIGVYGPRVQTRGHTMSIGAPWLHQYEIMLLIQESNPGGPLGSEESLARAIDQVWAVVNSNRRLQDTVDMVTGTTVEPFQQDVTEQDAISTSMILIEAEARG